MKITERSGVAEVAASVGDALEKAGIRAVLTGGACASQSSDLDFVIQGGARQVEGAKEGFERFLQELERARIRKASRGRAPDVR